MPEGSAFYHLQKVCNKGEMLGFTKQPGVSNINSINTVVSVAKAFCCNITMMPGSKGQKAVHACMIRLLNLGPAKHEEGVICVANQRIPNVCRIAGAACCGAIRNEIFRWHQLGAKDLLTPTSSQYRNQSMEDET